MAEGITGWRLHVGVIFPTPVPPRAVLEFYEAVPIFVAALGDLAQDRAIPGRLLLRYESQPGAEVASLREACAVADRRYHGARDDRPHPRHRHHPLASLILFRKRFDLSRHRCNALVQSTQSWTSSAMRLTILGDSASVFELRMSGNALRNGTTPCRTMMPRSIRKPRI